MSNINSPSYNIAQWLLKELNKVSPPKGLYIKNSLELVDTLKNITLDDDDILVSFDVINLFPSIPIDKSISAMDEWLSQNNLNCDLKNLYIETTKLCMNHSFFQFNNVYYKQTFGTSMGNPLSPLMAELFMSKFELELKDIGCLPNVWIRYVDDIFAIMKYNEVDKLLNILTNKEASINFTVEVETNKKLPFLDIEVERNENKLEFAVFRKNTTTTRFITSDSYNPVQHKSAVFHSLIHRLISLPLNIKNYTTEYNYIKNVALVNGYPQNLVDNIIKKKLNKKFLNESTTLYKQTENEQLKYTKVMYVPEITSKLEKVYKKHGMKIVYKNQPNLGNLLGNTKDKIDNLNKSGIYKISCNDCDKIYIGQTKRSINTRFKEHVSHTKYN